MRLFLLVANNMHIKELKRSPLTFAKKVKKADGFSLLKKLDDAYYNDNRNVVPDETYDILYETFKRRFPNDPYWKKIGEDIKPRNGIVKVKLPAFMPSLDKIRTELEVDKFLDSSPIVVSDKLDGISLLANYTNGKLDLVTTRGNGKVGQDISGVVPALNIPKKLKTSFNMVVRLEFIIPQKTFNSKYKSAEKEVDKFKTARNMGGGLLTRNKPSSMVSSFSCLAYDIISGDNSDKPLKTKLTLLQREGFDVVYHKLASSLSFDKLKNYLDRRIKASRYEIDGLVLTKNKSVKKALSLENPKHSKAFKVNSLESSKIVTVKEVEWNKSRHGKLIPRVKVDPVELGGVTVQNFTGHNAYFINNGHKSSEKNKGLPSRPINKNAKIRVIRSGDVIPYIMEVVTPARSPAIPDFPYKLDRDGVHYISTERETDDVRAKRLVHFFTSLGVEGVKLGVIQKLIDSGYRTLKSILKANPEDFASIDGFQARSAEKLHSAIHEGVKKAGFVEFAKGSGVFGDKIGERKLKEIYDKYPNIMEMTDTLNIKQLEEKISQVKGFDKMSLQIAKSLPKFKKFLDTYGFVISKKSTKKSSSRLSNLKVLFTSFRDKSLSDYIQENGGSVVSTVNQANIVLIKDESVSNLKTEKAKQIGIPVITVDKFKNKWVK